MQTEKAAIPPKVAGEGAGMGVWGAMIMGFFGSLFAALTLHWQWDIEGIALAAPFAIFAIVVVSAAWIIRMPGDGNILTERTARVIMWSSIAEGVGLFIASNIAANLHRPEWQLPAMALVVGLHFLPIAISASYRPFHALGAALIASAIVGFAVTAPAGGEIAGVTAATSLWMAACLGLGRDLRSKKSSRPLSHEAV